MNKTEKNLHEGFAGESMARNKYDIYAKVARKEGYRYIAKILEETALNEKRHAKDQFALLGEISDTSANLKAAIGGENYETTEMYPKFAAEAAAEGTSKAATLFKLIAKIEGHHRDRFKRLLEMVENGTVYKREKPIKWKCDVCGYIHEGKEPPAKCPACDHAREYFEPANMDV
jgi:rubrerythrin